ERAAERGSLAQDRRPGQARLEGLEADPFVHALLVRYGHAPFGVVVLAQQRVGARPGGTGQPVLADHGAGSGRPGNTAGIVVGAGRGHSVSSGWSVAGWSGAGCSAAGRIVAGWSVAAPAGLVDAGACLVASRDGHQ